MEDFAWIFCWLTALTGCIFLNLGKKFPAYLFLTTSLLISIPTLFFVHAILAVIWVVYLLLLLLYLWPLRFIGLGELFFSIFFGTFLCLPGITIASYNFLLLFVVVLMHKINQYPQHKLLQQYSLPVLLGRWIPALDRHWSKAPFPALQVLVWIGFALFIMSMLGVVGTQLEWFDLYYY